MQAILFILRQIDYFVLDSLVFFALGIDYIYLCFVLFYTFVLHTKCQSKQVLFLYAIKNFLFSSDILCMINRILCEILFLHTTHAISLHTYWFYHNIFNNLYVFLC